MALNRVRRGLSTLASGSNNRKSKATTQTRSTSGYSTCSNDIVLTDENLVGRTGEHAQFIKFDKLLTNDEAREGLALAPKQNSPPVSALYSEDVQGESKGHKDQASSNKAADIIFSLSEDPNSSHPAAAGISAEAQPSGSSSRRTTIFVGKPRQIATEEPQKGQANDETRLVAEQNYYESVNLAGTSRRRSMLRSVSKDDYLLARGANPRTGIVTPGVHSSGNSNEEADLLKQRGIAPPPKWRQRGDQWVSLDVGEPTPLPSPPNGSRTHHAGRPLRTPPRLTAGKYNHDSSSRKAYQKPSVSAALPEDMLTPDGFPGTFPISPQLELEQPPVISCPGPGPAIKRKPVGGPPRNYDDHAAPKQVTPKDSTDTVVKRPFAIQPRSSSAPAPRNMRFETPEDVGMDTSKALPSVPYTQKHTFDGTVQHIAIQEPFLGRKGLKWTGCAQKSVISALSSSEKELPCLPMSSGQSQLQPFQEASTNSSSVRTSVDESRTVKGPRGGNPAYPFVRNMRMAIPQRQYQNTPNTFTGTNRNNPLIPIPTYDNPPSQTTMRPRLMRGMIGGPRPMQQPRSVSENIRKATDFFTGPPSIMYTNTRIPTHISTLQPRLQGNLDRTGLGSEMSKELRMYKPMHDRIHPNDPRLWSGNMSNTVPMNKMSQSRPRAQSRPQMPGGADGHLRSVPRMSPHRSNHQVFMGNHHQWRMAGTSDDAPSERSDISAESTTKSEFDRILLPRPLRPTMYDRDTVTRTSSRNDENRNIFLREVEVSGHEPEDYSSQSSGLTRNCSHCHNGFVADSLRSTVGRTPPSISATVAEELKPRTDAVLQQKHAKDDHSIKETTVAPNSASTEEMVDERDHTACCTECCTVEDCHEGCLGHPSPSIRSFGGSTIVDRFESPSSLERGSRSSSVPASTPSSPLTGKPSFVQGVRMRKTLRTRQCPDDGKTIKERCNVLDSPPIELDSHPLSPGSFWDGGEGAASAAKKALGVKKRSATAPSAPAKIAARATIANKAKRIASPPRLVMPKVRDLRNRNAIEFGNVHAVSRASGSRNVSGASNLSAIRSASRSRNVSGASILSIEIPPIFSSLGIINVAGVLEMIRVPFEALAMWVQTHPEAQHWLWRGVERVMKMGKTVASTGGAVWEVSYVYSKTGRLRCKAPGGVPKLAVDCGRSVGYLLVFVALAVCVGRVLGIVLGFAQGLFCIVRAIGWLLKKLGLGLLW